MNRFFILFVSYFMLHASCLMGAHNNPRARAENTPRTTAATTNANQTVSRAASVRNQPAPTRATPAQAARGNNANVSRAATTNQARRPAVQSPATARSARAAHNIARATTNNQARSAVRVHSPQPGSRASKSTGIPALGDRRLPGHGLPQNRTTVARAAAIGSVQVLGPEFNFCREAYFACMDQFCGMRDERYRRCFCSSRLGEMRERERNFAAAIGMLRDFEMNELNVIDLTADEVRAMYAASIGEAAMMGDTSQSAGALLGISDILSSRPSDVGANLNNRNNVFNTTGMIGEAELMELEGVQLFNSVHSQCAEMVMAGPCADRTIFNMVQSAYGMQIEQDCIILSDRLDAQQRVLNNATRDAQWEMATLRLEHHQHRNAHEIIQCLINVNREMMGPAACGPNNIQCIDITGQFFSASTNQPLFTPSFFMLERQISLEGDVLTNPINTPFVDFLNSRRHAAAGALNRCADIAEDVWDEYLRQTLVDLSQRQVEIVRDVRSNCISMVQDCYDERGEQLRQFSAEADDTTAAARMELTEELCQVHLDSCAHLYGGGPPGLAKLREYVRNIQEAHLEAVCEEALARFTRDTCTPVNDNRHDYPFNCRFLEPGGFGFGVRGGFGPDQPQTTSLYDQIRHRAGEICVRPGTPGIPHNIEQIIQRLMSNIVLQMDGLLSEVCERGGGVWYTRTIRNSARGVCNSSNLLAFFETNTHGAWGVCLEVGEMERINGSRSLAVGVDECLCSWEAGYIPYNRIDAAQNEFTTGCPQ